MVNRKIRQRMIIFLIEIIMILKLHAEENDLSAIILWEHDDSLTVEYLTNNDIQTILKTNNPEMIFYFDNFKKFDGYKQEFIFENDKWFDEFKNKFKDISSVNSDGKYFFSIVVHNNIIMTGLNRINCIRANPMPLDELGLPYIAMTLEHNLKLTMDYVNGIFGYIDQKIENDILYRKIFEDYFKNE
ncbi:hypothetical protein [Treponema pedis]|uniref:Uncharacterized protein n=2 Tax=Treponema pedis TaxID=409322 RepID=S6A456_9SPIR|nr:hypothetical protein [Treponema pedis]AGT44101.1 hypothetical protein TPE_1615 [Treponema pedis str. T A4]